MYTFIHIYICMYAYICVCVSIYVCIYTHIHIHIYMHVCMYLCICMSVCLYVFIYVYVCVQLCIAIVIITSAAAAGTERGRKVQKRERGFALTAGSLDLRLYIYIYLYICIYIYVYIYIYISVYYAMWFAKYEGVGAVKEVWSAQNRTDSCTMAEQTNESFVKGALQLLSNHHIWTCSAHVYERVLFYVLLSFWRRSPAIYPWNPEELGTSDWRVETETVVDYESQHQSNSYTLNKNNVLRIT